VASTLHHFVVRRNHHLPHWLRMSRYVMGSAICFGVSEIVFVAVFWPHLLGARGASIVASIAGIIPGYHLNRSWTWGRRGRSDLWREIMPYWTTALLSTAIVAAVIGVANDAVDNWSRGTRTLVNAGAYMLTYGVLFLVKYVIFHFWLFKPPTAAVSTGAPGESGEGWTDPHDDGKPVSATSGRG
jgi:putative flippase GtrA